MQRHKLTGYDSINSPKGMPLIAIDGSPVFAAFDAIKKLVRIDPEAKTVTREQNEEAFWALTSEVAGGFKSVDVSAPRFHYFLPNSPGWVDICRSLAGSYHFLLLQSFSRAHSLL